jgi:Tfp pilus assembly protein FimV
MSRRRRKPRAAAGGRSSRPGAGRSAPGTSSRRPGIAHYAAPVAFLAGVTIAVLLVHSALDHRTGTGTTTPAPTVTTAATTTKKPTKRPGRRFYVVQSGDSFGTIAAKEGISVAQLEALNPGVSSNALRVGQKLRIR